MTDGFAVRPREERDLDACARLLVAVHAHDGYPVEGVADPRGWLALGDQGQAWVAAAGERIVGHIGLGPDADDGAAAAWKAWNGRDGHRVASISRLFVAPGARRHGVARALMARAAEAARVRDWALVLDVMEKDRAAIRLYERTGWVRIGKLPHEFGGGKRVPALVYALSW